MTYIIAEAGVNHNGSLTLAKQLVNAACAAKADAIKFQTFKADRIISRNTPKARYQAEKTGNHESQLEMVRSLELSLPAHRTLYAYCKKVKIDFLSTPFDIESVAFLARLGVQRLKISSGEITNAPLLLKASRTNLPIILSTGMATLGEIEQALAVCAFGYTFPTQKPSCSAFLKAYQTAGGQAALQNKVVLLHCTTEYPAKFTDVNLRAMDTMQAAFGLPVGLSDHTSGIAVAVAAVARGATIIEKHLTLDKQFKGPDHAASLEPSELKALVTAVRTVEQCLGSKKKIPALVELANKTVARKSIVALKKIKKNERFTTSNITTKRPEQGLSPMRYFDVLGQKALKDFNPDDPITQ